MKEDMLELKDLLSHKFRNINEAEELIDEVKGTFELPQTCYDTGKICPLVDRWCSDECICFKEGGLSITQDMFTLEYRIIIQDARCTNKMFGFEVMSEEE